MTVKIDDQEYVALEELKDDCLEEMLQVVEDVTTLNPEFTKVDATFEICTLLAAGLADHNKIVKEMADVIRVLNNQCRDLEKRVAILENFLLPAWKDVKCEGNC